MNAFCKQYGEHWVAQPSPGRNLNLTFAILSFGVEEYDPRAVSYYLYSTTQDNIDYSQPGLVSAIDVDYYEFPHFYFHIRNVRNFSETRFDQSTAEENKLYSGPRLLKPSL